MRVDVDEFITTVDAIAYLPRDVMRVDCTLREGKGRAGRRVEGSKETG
jgi:hypothetical protein